MLISLQREKGLILLIGWVLKLEFMVFVWCVCIVYKLQPYTLLCVFVLFGYSLFFYVEL